MKGFLKFLALAVAGFALGAGAAWLQQPHTPSTTTVTPPPFPAKKTPGKSDALIEETPDTAKDVLPAPKAAEEETPAKEEKAATEEKPAEESKPVKAAEQTEASSSLTSETTEAAPDKKDAEAAKNDKDAAPVKKEEIPPEVASNLAAAKGDAPSAEAGIGGAFTLKDHHNNEVTEKSWPGKYLMVFFGFTSCPDICPVTLDKMTSVLNQLGDDAAKVQPLFITVDPQRDTPYSLQQYLGHFHKSILGLTGTETQIKAAEDAYKVYAAKQTQKNGQYSFDHSAFVYFMAPDGKMAEVIKMNDKASEIVDKIKPYLTGEKKADAGQ